MMYGTLMQIDLSQNLVWIYAIPSTQQTHTKRPQTTNGPQLKSHRDWYPCGQKCGPLCPKVFKKKAKQQLDTETHTLQAARQMRDIHPDEFEE